MEDEIQTRLNDVPFSANSCSWNIAGAPYVGITSLAYGQKRDRTIVAASMPGGVPAGITSGDYKVEGLSITFLRSAYQRLIVQLSVLGLGSYGNAIFPIVAKYSDVQAQLRGEKPIVITIIGARICGEKDSREANTEALVTEVELMAMSLTRNGLRLW